MEIRLKNLSKIFVDKTKKETRAVDDFNTNFLIGLSYKGIGEYEYAWDYLNKAYELDPTNENLITQIQDLEYLFNK